MTKMQIEKELKEQKEFNLELLLIIENIFTAFEKLKEKVYADIKRME